MTEKLIYAERLKSMLEQLLDEAPAVNIVRCGDCKYYNTGHKNDSHGRCQMFGLGKNDIIIVYGGFFCAHGERRAENATD